MPCSPVQLRMQERRPRAVIRATKTAESAQWRRSRASREALSLTVSELMVLVGKLKDRAVVNELGERVPALDVPADIAHRRRAFAVGHPLTEQLFDALEHFGDPDDPLATSRRNTEDRVTASPDRLP